MTVQLSGVSMSFGSQPVLHHLDLEVTRGVTSVLGQSGCGKTTLLRLVAGFLEPDAGTICLDGLVVAGRGRSVPPQRRRVGYVPQEGALFPHLDVAANIAFGLPRSQRHGHRLEEMLDLVELPRSVAGRFPHELSGGQQQRVALARALAPEPAVVLLDEPFSSLDASLREDTGRAVVRALRAADATAVLVTHDQGEALSLSDRVAVLSHGRLVQVATPAQLYLAPVDQEVARFVGGAILLPGTVTGARGECALGIVGVQPGGHQGESLLALRPEQLAIEAGTTGGAPADVVAVSFFGHDATVRAHLVDGGALVTARTPAEAVPAPGQRVRLRVTGAAISFPPELPA